MALFHFNPRAGAQKKEKYTYLDDRQEWLKAKRKLRSTIERTFCTVKATFRSVKLTHSRTYSSSSVHLFSLYRLFSLRHCCASRGAT